ncbi:SGNH/GDSL hydrolase family protein [Ramlibacter sp. MAHUQ-53]|uniref:SGNH/GDSL hydrolase family protein n=1 Tax=unclassified Ramlibacter TaxID=2617605 RepID=UPI00363E64DB
MAFPRLRRAVLALACVAPVLLAACGGGTGVVSQFRPTRMVAFGDGLADLGEVGGKRYTINDGSVNVWTQQVASRFGLVLTTRSAGGTSYATGNARILATPDAAGNAATPTLKAQVDSFLAAGGPATQDMLLVSAGTADMIAEATRAFAGQQTVAQARANLEQAARDYAAQVRRLVQGGARHVVIAGPYNLGRSPWAIAIGQVATLEALSTAFNNALLVAAADLGEHVLYVDMPLQFNQFTGFPTSYALTNVTGAACASVDAGAGIGIGTGQVNSALCTSSTLGSGVTPDTYLFADLVYPTPFGHRTFGDYAYQRVTARW